MAAAVPPAETRAPTWLSIAVHQDVQHTCQICSENVVWHADTITRHLEAAHNITTAEYAAAHMATYK